MKTDFPTIFNRITFITRLVMNDDMLTMEDIARRWQDSLLYDGYTMTRKTFRKDRDMIYRIFGLNIDFKKMESGVYVYRITNKDRIRNDSVLRWTMETLSTAEICKHSINHR